MPDILIVGAGLSGSVIARHLAELDYNITIFEERRETGGNCRDYRDEKTGINIHRYGPHIFHTDIPEVWEYVNRFAEMIPYTNRVKAKTAEGVFSLPVNLLTLSQLFNREFTPREAYDFIGSQAVKTDREPQNFEEQALSMMGEKLYSTFFHGYTLKQWGRDPKELPASILKRLPFRFNYDDNYFTHPWQGMPKDGYVNLIDNILDHRNIAVELGRSFLPDDIKNYDHVFYSGQIDRFFDFKLGRLEYRTLDFERFEPSGEETLNGDYQGCAVVNYNRPEVPYTRITEHKHFAPWEEHEETVCYSEYSRSCGPGDIPYYPVRLSGKNELLDRYRAEAEKLANVTFVGRLGLYEYFDMDKTIDAALKTARQFAGRPDKSSN